MFDILTEIPQLTIIIILAWLPVITIALIHLFKRKDISMQYKILWLIVGLIPVLGLLIYGFFNYKTQRTILIATIGALAISAFSVWYYLMYEPVNNRRDPGKEKAIANTAASILQEFKTNEEVASKKYINKVVELTGEVDKIETDERGTILYLKTGTEGSTISCSLKEKQIVTPNTNITVKGILNGYILEQIQLSEAIVVQGAFNNTTKIDSVQTAKKPDTAKTIIPKDTSKIKEQLTKIYKSIKGQIVFHSSTSDEDIEATNTQVISSINSKGEIQMVALIKGFRFENEIMQNHFNEEKYMHSDKFPKSEFKGTISNFNNIGFDKNSDYEVTAKGTLTLHGVSKPVTATGNIHVNNGKLNIKGSFKIHVQDYGVDGSDVADQIDVIVNCTYQ